VNLPRNLRSGYLNEDVEDYLYGLLPQSDEVVAEMEAYAAKNDVPIIGPAVARLLSLFVQISGAKRIFELGSAIGYSTVWLARAAGPDAQITYTDGDPEKARRAAGYFERAGVASRIRIETGDALSMLEKTPGEFDLIFNDINKHEYPAAAKAAIPRIRKGGLLVADNTLWSGKVAQKAANGDDDTAGIQEMNRWAYDSKELYTVLIPLRDGVTVCRKL
jgi:caffeoyl-CoA O-methyltransferase